MQSSARIRTAARRHVGNAVALASAASARCPGVVGPAATALRHPACTDALRTQAIARHALASHVSAHRSYTCGIIACGALSSVRRVLRSSAAVAVPPTRSFSDSASQQQPSTPAGTPPRITLPGSQAPPTASGAFGLGVRPGTAPPLFNLKLPTGGAAAAGAAPAAGLGGLTSSGFGAFASTPRVPPLGANDATAPAAAALPFGAAPGSFRLPPAQPTGAAATTPLPFGQASPSTPGIPSSDAFSGLTGSGTSIFNRLAVSSPGGAAAGTGTTAFAGFSPSAAGAPLKAGTLTPGKFASGESNLFPSGHGLGSSSGNMFEEIMKNQRKQSADAKQRLDRREQAIAAGAPAITKYFTPPPTQARVVKTPIGGGLHDGHLNASQVWEQRQEEMRAAKLQEAHEAELARIAAEEALQERLAAMTPDERYFYDTELSSRTRERRQRRLDRDEYEPDDDEDGLEIDADDAATPESALIALKSGPLPLYLASLEGRINFLQNLQRDLHLDDARIHRREQSFKQSIKVKRDVQLQLQRSRPEMARQQGDHISIVEARHAMELQPLMARRAQRQADIDQIVASLDLTQTFAAGGLSHLNHVPSQAPSVTLLDGRTYALDPRDRQLLLDSEKRIGSELKQLHTHFPDATPTEWWEMLRDAMAEEHDARLAAGDARDLTIRTQADGDVQAQQQLTLEQAMQREKRIRDNEPIEDEDDHDDYDEDRYDDDEDDDVSYRRDEDLDDDEDGSRSSRIGAGKSHAVRLDSLMTMLGRRDDDDAPPQDVDPARYLDEVEARLSPALRHQNAEALLQTQKRDALGRIESIKESRRREVPVFNVQTMSSVALALGVAVKTLTAKLRELDLSVELGSQSVIREDVARLLIEEYGFTPVAGVQVVQPQVMASLRRKAMKSEQYLALPTRPPVITVMGHVDHGKTTLLDRLRSENRASGEAGGITQAIGAFRVQLAENPDDGVLGETDDEGKPNFATFLDTPGHAAFKSMRAKGCSSSCTDMVILVISAADGLQPQSMEVIQLARQNNVPLIIAVNKIDVSGADPDAILQQLQVHDVVVESLGGEVLSCNISAKTGEGIDELKELIRLTSEILQLHADRECSGEAYVLESRVLKQGGCVANILVRNGSVSAGQYFVCGLQHGKIRTLQDENQRAVRGAVYPGQAAQLTGLRSLDDLTEDLYIVNSESEALQIISDRQELVGLDESVLLAAQQNQMQIDQKVQAYKIQVTRRRKRVAIRPLTPEEQVIQTMKDNAVPVLIKADVSGSMDVLLDYFSKLPRDEVLCSIAKTGLGEINMADIEYASEIGGDASVFGFNVKASSEALLLAKQKGIRIFTHQVIYSLWDDVRDLMSEKLPVEMEEAPLGSAEVQQLFPLSSNGGKKKAKADANAAAAGESTEDATPMVAGCRVKMGKMDAKMKFKIMRDEELVFDGACQSLRVNRDSKPFVEKGAECGIRLSAGADALLRVGDVIECYTLVRKKKVLDDSAARGFTQAPDGANMYNNAAFYE